MIESLRDHCVMFGEFLLERPEMADYLGSPVPPDVTQIHAVMEDDVVLQAWLRWLVTKIPTDDARDEVNRLFAQRGWPLIATTPDG